MNAYKTEIREIRFEKKDIERFNMNNSIYATASKEGQLYIMLFILVLIVIQDIKRRMKKTKRSVEND